MKNQYAVILCGGRGSRLGAITDNIPKSLVKVRGKELLWWTVLNLYHQGFRHFILPMGYKGEMIHKYVRKTFKPLSGAMFMCPNTGEDTSIAKRIEIISPLMELSSHMFLVNGDTLFDFQILEMYRQHLAEENLVTLSSVSVPAPWGVIFMHEDRIISFDRARKIQCVIHHANPEIRGIINAGLTWIKREALHLLDFENCGDFETAIFNLAIEMKRIGCYKINGIWYPVDTQKDLEVINMEVSE